MNCNKAEAVAINNYGITESKAWILAGLFVLANVLFPQICHLFGIGHILLPIYFFTLIASYKYGLTAGLLTSIASPLVSSALFGMPVPSVLPVILTKSVLLALSAWIVSQYGTKSLILNLLITVVSYQTLGFLAEWIFISGDFSTAFYGVKMGLIGMLFQIIGGYAFLKFVLK